MDDILIEFLTQLLSRQQNLTKDLSNFISGLTGKPFGQNMENGASTPTDKTSATNAPIFFSGGSNGSETSRPRFRLVYDKDDPSVKEKYFGGGAKSQSVSNAQSLIKESEDLKHITKRADGRWQASKTINGKRIFVYGKTQLETRNKLRELLGRKMREPKRDPLGKFALWWLETYKKGNVSETTYKNYEYTISAHLKQISTPINKVTTVQLQELLNKMPASRIRKEVYKLLRQVIRKAYELDFIKKDVSEFLTVGKVQSKTRESLTLEEQKRLLAALGDDMFSRRVLFYLCTGARPSEIKTIKKEELRPGWVKINGTKTAAAVRWVKISERLSSMLMGESPEFFNFDNKRFRQHLQRFCEQNKICENIDVYTLRHTFATNLYILRVPEKDRQTYMGHAPGSVMTNAVYTTFSPDTTPENIYDIYGDLYPKF